MNNEPFTELEELGVDVASALRRFGGKPELFMKYIRLFPEDTSFAELAAAMQSGDTEAAMSAAHTLKGVSGNLGFSEISRMSNSVLVRLREGRYTDASAAAEELSGEYADVLARLEKILSE